MRPYLKVPPIIFLISLLYLFIGCASTTKPNNPYIGSYPSKFSTIQAKNPLLAHELGKLPEIQDGISESEGEAVNKLAELYLADPDTFDNVFEQMYRVGLPEFRRYCTPLQALFWLSEDGDIEGLNKIVVDYTLKGLLDVSWKYKKELPIFTKEEISKIITGIKEDKKKNQAIERAQESQTRVEKLIFRNYKRNSSIFTREAKKIIKRRSELLIDPRWSDFNTVVERLNAPELIDYYERHVISYKYRSGYGEGPEEARRVFRNKYGHCAQVTAFTVYILQKAGYESRRYIVANPALRSPKGNYHRACLFIVKGEKYIMDNGRGTPMGIVRFEEYDDSVSPTEAERIQGIPMIRTR